WLKARAEWIDAQFPAEPEFSVASGNVPVGTSLIMNFPEGQAFYTTDGSDPRASGGGVSPTAKRFDGGAIDSTLLPMEAPVDYLVPTNNSLRMTLDGEYSDASLRYHFSVMSCDPKSPIAKVEKGQGYYKRGAAIPALSSAKGLLAMTQGRLDDLDDSSSVDTAMLRLSKFRAIVQKYAETKSVFTFEFRESLSVEAPLGNLWKFPEIVLIDWEHGEFDEDGLALDPAHLALKQTLGLPPYHLSSIRMRVETSHDNFREDLFQTMSGSMWANEGILYLADSISDESLGDQVRALASELGIGVVSFGLSPNDLDDLPHPAQIQNAIDRETEALMGRLHVEKIAPAKRRTHCGWESLQFLRNDHLEMNQLLAWLGGALENGKVKPFQSLR
ncbi:hypothetical protein N9Z46_10355, partial [Akkermansiaceae bacterium]|nr:hypothetical protein [Akkermansiaceae bacterium]